MKDQIAITVFLTILVLIIAALIFGGSWAMEAYRCGAKYSTLGETSYGPVKGCMVQVDGKFVPASLLRQVNP